MQDTLRSYEVSLTLCVTAQNEDEARAIAYNQLMPFVRVRKVDDPAQFVSQANLDGLFEEEPKANLNGLFYDEDESDEN